MYILIYILLCVIGIKVFKNTTKKKKKKKKKYENALY